MKQKTLVLMMVAACGGLMQAQTPAGLTPPPVTCQWQFESDATQSAPEGSVAGLAKVTPGKFTAGWLAENPTYGSAKGIWDLGKSGAIQLSLPPEVTAGAGEARLITLRVVQYQDGAIYSETAKISVPGANLVGEKITETSETVIGEWVTVESQWQVPAGAAADSVQITGAMTGTLVDQVSVASTTLPAAPQLSIERVGADKSQVRVSWTEAGTEMVLESNTNLNNPDGWTLVKEPAQLNGAVRSLTTEAMETPRFYRLKRTQP